MATFIMTAKLTQKALAGMLAKPEDRGAALAKLVEAAGGKMTAYYFTTGPTDLLMIIEADGPEVVATAAMVAGAAGTGSGFCTVQAFTTAEFKAVMEKAGGITGSYRHPGS
ncbi:MAG: GYD domain-containing protein [Rhodobacteraceae bacterium]|nr:GYD domain-containing protein [Paracoccaceae bacterium]